MSMDGGTEKEVVVHIFHRIHYSSIKRNEFESVELRCMNLRPVTHSEVRKRKTNIVYLRHIHGI